LERPYASLFGTEPRLVESGFKTQLACLILETHHGSKNHEDLGAITERGRWERFDLQRIAEAGKSVEIWLVPNIQS
jgi:hypothetical protein